MFGEHIKITIIQSQVITQKTTGTGSDENNRTAMKKDRNQIDDFFRESLEDYRIPPSEESKQAFLKEAEHMPGKTPLIKKWWSLFIPVFLILIPAGLIIYYNHVPVAVHQKQENSTQPAIAPNVKSQPQITPSQKNSEPGQNEITPKQNEIISGITQKVTDRSSINYEKDTEIIRETSSHEKKTSDNLIGTAPNRMTGDLIPVDDPASGGIYSPDTIPVPGTIALPAEVSGLSDTLSEFSGTMPLSGNQSAIPDTSDLTGTIRKDIPVTGLNAQREWRLGTGVYFSPEWMFRTLEDTKFITNFGIEGTFRFGRYSIRTGAGLSISKGTNQLQIEYNDYLGSYMKLDSMTFTWDNNHHQIIPLAWYLTNKDVYDSLMKLEDAKIVKRYTYLQVPLILGYDFFQRNKVSMGFRAGPVLSVLLSEKILSDTYDPGKKRIISINEITPEQVNLNWEIMVGFNAAFRLWRNLGIEIEPYGKYYFNSVYQSSGNTGKPWSVGLRASLFISFQK